MLLGKAYEFIGRVSKGASDLVVFTIASTSTATEKTLEKSGKIIKKITHMVNGNKTKKNKKTKKSRKKSTTRKSK